MPVYRYRARDKFGKLVTGSTDSDTKEVVVKHFESLGYTLISIKEEKPTQVPIFRKAGRVKQEDMNLFNRQLVTLIKAGLPLLAGLTAIEKQTESNVLKAAIQAIIKDIEGGSNFSDALRRYPNIFDDLYINTIKAAEASGTLDEVLTRLAELGEHEAATKAKIKSATRYPFITVTVLAIGFFILVIFVIPQFVVIFDRFETGLPLPTRILIWINNAVHRYWHITLITLAALVYGFKKSVATEGGRKIWDNLKIKVPIFGPLILIIIMSRVCRIMSIMLRSGVPILRTLDLLSNATGNVIVTNAIKDIMRSVNQGKSMTGPMAESRVFTPMVVQMVAVGEETGQIDKLLLHVSEYYDEQSDYIIKNLTTMIEPILVVILACGVLVLALAIFLPMWNMIGLFRGG